MLHLVEAVERFLQGYQYVVEHGGFDQDLAKLELGLGLFEPG